MNKFKQNTVMIVGVILMVVAMVGASYAFFTINISNDNAPVNQAITTASLTATFAQGNNIVASNMLPTTAWDTINPNQVNTSGESIPNPKNDFSITSNGGGYVNYNLYLLVNEIDPALAVSDLKWELYLLGEPNSLVNSGTFLGAANGKTITLKTAEVVDPYATKNYSLRIYVYETGNDQQVMLNKSMNAKISFEEANVYTDNSHANYPELADGMIPVVYQDNVWKVADLGQKWYDYDELMWANVVTVTEGSGLRGATAGTTIPESAINGWWVWIPRYSYMIENNGLGVQGYGGSTPAKATPGAITIKFVDVDTKETGNATSSYLTHPTFRDGTVYKGTNNYDLGGWNGELPGIWIGKFETSFELNNGSLPCTAANYSVGSACDVTSINPVIKPNVTSWRGIRVSTMELVSRKFTGNSNIYGLPEKSSTTDAHMMKNSEWGAVAYLSQSKYGKYGNTTYAGALKEVYLNNSSSYYTGRSVGSAPGGSAVANGTYSYDGTQCTNAICNTEAINKTKEGYGASTTGTIYGIYDMSGGAFEYVMGNLNGVSGYDATK